MNRIKNILACLDLTYIDPILIEYADFFSGSIEAEKVYFLHVIQEYALPEKGGRIFPIRKNSMISSTARSKKKSTPISKINDRQPLKPVSNPKTPLPPLSILFRKPKSTFC